MPGQCIVPQCTVNTIKNKGQLKWHRLPKDELLKKAWLFKLRVTRQLKQHSVVCSRHFVDSDYIITGTGQWRILRKGAIPSCNLPNKSCERRVKQRRPPKTRTSMELTGKRSYDASKPDFVPNKFVNIKTETEEENPLYPGHAAASQIVTSLSDEKLTAMLSTTIQTMDQTPRPVFDPMFDKTVGCVGCFRRLQVGAVPKGLAFPSGAGVNVWCKVPESTTNIPPVGSVMTAQVTEQKNVINLCNDCFTAHMSGRKTFALNVLGISIVTALYKEDTKYLKVEGPTKVVTLGGEFECDYMTDVTEDAIKKAPASPKRRGRARKILRPLTPPSDEESYSASATGNQMPKSEGEVPKAAKRGSKKKVALPDLHNEIGYLSIGTGYLGSVEMTDDCYDHITIKQEPPDMSEMCILPEMAESSAYEDTPPFHEGNFIQPKVEMEDERISNDELD